MIIFFIAWEKTWTNEKTVGFAAERAGRKEKIVRKRKERIWKQTSWK